VFYPPGCYQPFTGTDIIATIKLLKKVLSKTSFFGQTFFVKERLRVNRTGGILTL